MFLVNTPNSYSQSLEQRRTLFSPHDGDIVMTVAVFLDISPQAAMIILYKYEVDQRLHNALRM